MEIVKIYPMIRMRSEKRFPLLELIIVAAIMGIIAAIALPGYITMKDRAQKKAVQRSAQSAVPEMQQCLDPAIEMAFHQNVQKNDTKSRSYLFPLRTVAVISIDAKVIIQQLNFRFLLTNNDNLQTKFVTHCRYKGTRINDFLAKSNS